MPTPEQIQEFVHLRNIFRQLKADAGFPADFNLPHPRSAFFLGGNEDDEALFMEFVIQRIDLYIVNNCATMHLFFNGADGSDSMTYDQSAHQFLYKGFHGCLFWPVE